MAGLFSGLWKGLFGSRQDELNEQATEESIFQMQHPFARTMQDAQVYGINPITALGSTPSASTYSGSSASSSPADSLGLLAPIMQSVVSRENNSDALETQERMNKETLASNERIANLNNATQRDYHNQQYEIARLNYELDKLIRNKELSLKDKRLILDSHLSIAQIQDIKNRYEIECKRIIQNGQKLTEEKRHNIVSEIISGVDTAGRLIGPLMKLLGLSALPF